MYAQARVASPYITKMSRNGYFSESYFLKIDLPAETLKLQVLWLVAVEQ